MSDDTMRNLHDKEFWDLFFQTEELAEYPALENERVTIEMKYSTGEKRVYPGVCLKKMLKKKSS